jgi:hypothetical protein
MRHEAGESNRRAQKNAAAADSTTTRPALRLDREAAKAKAAMQKTRHLF